MTTRSARLRSILARCRDDPERFAAAVLGSPPFDDDARGRPFWGRQREASGLVVKHHTTVLPWGNALGKSWWVARLALWWLCTRDDAVIVTTSPTFQQLDSVLWRNIRQAVGGSLVPLGLALTRKPLSARFDESSYMLGVATTSTERMSGHHSANLLVIADEASGIEAPIWEAIDSLVPAKVVLIGNPIRPDGQFKDRYDLARDQDADGTIPDAERVATLRVPSTDSPHAGQDHSPLGLACGSWLRRMAAQYGTGSLWWRTHVLAEFPAAQADDLIPAAWIDRAATAQRVAPPGGYGAGTPRIGIDLGEGVGRDRSVVLCRDDLGILEATCDRAMGLDEVAAEAARLAAKWQVPHDQIAYDAAGIGRGLPDRLARHGIEARPYHGAGAGGKRFKNLRSASGWALRDRLDPDRSIGAARPFERMPPFVIPPREWYPALREELISLRYSLAGDKVKLEPKVDCMARLGRSPDVADALVMTFSW